MVNAPVSNSTVMKINRMVLNFISYIFKITYILYVNSGLVVTTGVRCFGFDSTFCKFYACSCILTWIEKNQESGLLVALITWIEKNRESGFLVARIPGLKKIEKLEFWSFEYLDSWIVATTKQSLDSIEWISLNKTNLDNDSWVKTKSHHNVISGEGIVAKMWHDNSMKNHGKTWQFVTKMKSIPF